MDGPQDTTNTDAYATDAPPSYELLPVHTPHMSAPPQQYPPTAAAHQQAYTKPHSVMEAPQQDYVSPAYAQLAQQGYVSPGAQPMSGQPTMTGSLDAGVRNLRQFPAPCLCPNCGQTKITRVEHKVGKYTLKWAFVAAFLGCCCCIPFMINGLKDVHHFCPNCNIPLAVWERSSGTLQVLTQSQATGPPN